MKTFLLPVAFALAFVGGVPAADVPAAEAHREISALRREIGRHDELYHREAAPEIEDAAYDRLRQRLSSLEQKYPEAAKSVPSLREIGDDRSGRFPAYRHRVPMLSLEKAHGLSDVRTFHARLAKTVGDAGIEFVVEPKYDGLAVSVTYERGKLVRAVTRGNGSEGDDITANVLAIPGLPRDLEWKSEAVPELIELRGEIHVPLAEFERVNAGAR